MPEIAEIEKLRRQLTPAWTGRRIIRWTAPETSPKPKRYFQGSWTTLKKMTSKPCQGIERVGKSLGIMYSDREFLSFHMKSTGWWMPGNAEATKATATDEIVNNFLHPINPKSVRVKAHFDDGQEWWYHDPRAWGQWFARSGQHMRDDPYFKSYGPDWIEKPNEAKKALHLIHSRRKVRDILTDQAFTAGIGYYISVEGCFRAGIHPYSVWIALTSDQIDTLGRVIDDFIQRSLIEPDHSHWNVFGKDGQPCPIHPQQMIEYYKKPKDSRGSYICSVCQPLLTKDDIPGYWHETLAHTRHISGQSETDFSAL